MRFPNIAIYIRVSTTGQAEEGISMQSQPSDVLRKLKLEFGEGNFTYEIFQDEGKSGGTGPMAWDRVRKPRDRKGLWDMLQRLKAGEFTHVAAFRLDRLYRNKLGYMGLYQEIMVPQKMKFILVADTFDESLAGRLTQGILAELAEYQRLQASDNIKKNLDFRRSEGYYLGTVPFGWRRDTPEERNGGRSNILPVEREKSVVLRIKNAYLEGKSEQAIAKMLNAEGVAHKKSVGRWHAGTVNLVLVNPTHAGLVRQNEGEPQNGRHYEHRFYDQSELALILARIKRNRRKLCGVVRTQPFRLFSGIAFCGHCGKKLEGSFHTDSPGYRCLGNSYSSDGSHVYISARTLEQLVVAELSHLGAQADVYGEIEKQIELLVRGQDEKIQQRAAEIRASQRELEGQREAVIEAIALRTISGLQARKKLGELEESITKLNAEAIELDRELNQSESRVEQIQAAKRAVSKFGQVWDHLEDFERREALHCVIERIDAHAQSDRKWISIKFIFSLKPVEVEVLRGAERYRADKLDGVASLTPRELAALKHVLDGAGYGKVAKYFESTASNAHSLLRRASIKVGAKSFVEAAKMAEPVIRRLGNQLPLFGKASTTKHSPKKLKVMEYQILGLCSEGRNPKEVALRTGIDEDRVESMLAAALAKLGVDNAKDAVAKLAKDDRFLPVSMSNRRKAG